MPLSRRHRHRRRTPRGSFNTTPALDRFSPRSPLVTLAPAAEPFYADAVPDADRRPAGRRAAAATASPARPASMRALGPAPRRARATASRCPAARARHHLAGAQPDPLGGLVRRGRAGLREAPRQLRPGRRRRAVDGRRAGPAARRRPRPRGRRARAGQPGGQHRAQGRRSRCRCSSTWCRSFPGIANDIKKPGVEEHGYTRTPLKAAHSMMRAWKHAARGPAQGHPAAADVPVRRGPRRRPVVGADDPRQRSPRAT